MSKKATVYIVYVPDKGWYVGDNEYSPEIDSAWSSTDQGVAQSYADLYNGTVYARHFEYSVGPVNNVSRFA